MKLYRVDPDTGEAMDEVYYLKQRLASDPSQKDVRDRLNALKSQRRMKLLAEAGVSYVRPYKRSDLPAEIVLAMIHTYAWRAYEVLCETFPYKVVQAAYLRDAGKGLINYGTSLHRPWVDPDGEKLIRSEKYKVIC